MLRKFSACFSLVLCVAALSACTNLPDMNTAEQATKQEDYQTAKVHYEELSEFGLPKAKIELGKMYLYGRGVESNPEKALALFEEARAAGEKTLSSRFIPKAQAKIGAMALNGQSNLSTQQAIKLLKQAAATGDADALFNLAQAHEKGSGVKQDGQLADQYYQQAAVNNYPRAEFYRAQLHQRGELIPKSIDTAIQLYESAATKGYARAYLELAKIYESGQDLPQNYEKAENYYVLAKQNGLPVDKDLERVQAKAG